MESYEAVKSTSLSDSSRIQTLQRSISVHEVAIASLKGEFERQNSELVASEEEVSKLRQALDKKARKAAFCLV
jgi:Skp family chaperone for outer membrane proteins